MFKRVCCQSISETLNESRKRTRTFSGLFVRISTLTYCIPYILHVHDSIGACFSNISAYFARNAEITQESSRKSCSLAGGFVPTRSHRRHGGGRARRYLVVIRVLAFVSSGVMISIKSIDVHIGHEGSVGGLVREEITNISNRISVMFVLLAIGGAPVGLVLVLPLRVVKWRCGRSLPSFSSGLCRYA